jgi:hypothetical protein
MIMHSSIWQRLRACALRCRFFVAGLGFGFTTTLHAQALIFPISRKKITDPHRNFGVSGQAGDSIQGFGQAGGMGLSRKPRGKCQSRRPHRTQVEA